MKAVNELWENNLSLSDGIMESLDEESILKLIELALGLKDWMTCLDLRSAGSIIRVLLVYQLLMLFFFDRFCASLKHAVVLNRSCALPSLEMLK